MRACRSKGSAGPRLANRGHQTFPSAIASAIASANENPSSSTNGRVVSCLTLARG